jgi:hypothetical protein
MHLKILLHPVLLVLLLGVCAPARAAVAPPAAGDVPIALGSRLELFVDDSLIDRMTGAALKLHSPVRAETVLKFDQPWEGSSCGYFTVINDNGLYRLYYRGSAPSPDNKDVHTEKSPMTVCYAESRDGINWTRPNLGLVEFRGSKDNNILLMGQDALSFTPFLDANPAAPASERFKAVTGTKVPDVKKGYALVGYTSPDGIRWTKVGDYSIIPDTTVNAFDSQNIVFWDTIRKKYVAFYRVMKAGVRWSKFAESSDFTRWPAESIQWFNYGHVPMEHLYTAAARPYERAPHIYVGFPTRYVPHRTSPHQPDKVNFGVNDGVFMSSRDGVNWDRRFLEAFLRPGRDPLNWTDRNNYTANGLLQTAPDELSLYFSQNYRSSSAHLRRGVLRLDGMVSVNAGYEGGEFVTKPFVYKGDNLVLNFATSAVGSIRLELQDARGIPIPGYELENFVPLWGDQIEHPVVWSANPTWGSSLKKLEGIPVRLRVVLRDADLYSMQFRPAKKADAKPAAN